MNIRLLLITLVLTAPNSFAADASSYQQLVDAGKSFLEKGDAVAASQKLREATAADANRHEGYFYLAVSAYRTGNLSAAEDYAKLALERAPEAKKAEVHEMIQVIDEKRKFEEFEREGDVAMAGGLMAKAASSYRKAYLLFPKQGKVGLRAAEIYADRLNKLLEAAVLWQSVVRHADAESAAVARAAKTRYARQLEALEQTLSAEAKRSGDVVQLIQLTEAFPDNSDLHVELAIAFARKNDVGGVIKHLSEAVKGGAPLQAIQRREELQNLLVAEEGESAFGQFIEDAFGSDVARSMSDGARQRQFAQEERELKKWAGVRRQVVVGKINETLGEISGYHYSWKWPGKKRNVFTKKITLEFGSLSYDDRAETYTLSAKKIISEDDSKDRWKYWTTDTETSVYTGFRFRRMTGVEVDLTKPAEDQPFGSLGLSNSLGGSQLPCALVMRFEEPFHWHYRDIQKAGEAYVPSQPYESKNDAWSILVLYVPQENPAIQTRLIEAFNYLKTMDGGSVKVLRQLRSEAEKRTVAGPT